MAEICAVCKEGKGPTTCEICGFSDEGVINREFPIKEDLSHWLKTVVKPYRIYWDAKKREAGLIAQIKKMREGETKITAFLVQSQKDLQLAKNELEKQLAESRQHERRSLMLLQELQKRLDESNEREAGITVQLQNLKAQLAESHGREAQLRLQLEGANNIVAEEKKHGAWAELFERFKQARVVVPLSLPNFVYVRGGTFRMGSHSGGNDDERPVRNVTVSDFYIGKFPVTQREWCKVMGANPSHFKGDNFPVEMVSWFDVIEYANKRSLQEGLTPAYAVKVTENNWDVDWNNRNANGYRLPTEAEWEYAARGGHGTPGNFEYSGSNNADDVAWYDRNSWKCTQSVGEKAPNDLGLYDMGGNVWEWVWDRYGPYPNAAETDPVGPSAGSHCTHRGGSWSNSTAFVRSATRLWSNPSNRSSIIGFRLVRSYSN